MNKFNILYNLIKEEIQSSDENSQLNIDPNELINNLHNILNSKKLNKNIHVLERMNFLAQRLICDVDYFEDLKKILIEKIGLKETQSVEIVDNLQYKVKGTTLIALYNYIKNEDNRIDINNYLNEKLNIYDLFEMSNLPESNKLCKYFLNKKFPSDVSMGSAELLLSILFKDAKLNIQKEKTKKGEEKSPGGDIKINNDLLEVKCSMRK